MQRLYKSEAAKRKFSAAREKRDDEVHRKMPCLSANGSDAKLQFNAEGKKPSLNEHNNEYEEINEAEGMSKSRYQISFSETEINAVVYVSKPLPALENTEMTEAESVTPTSGVGNLRHACHTWHAKQFPMARRAFPSCTKCFYYSHGSCTNRSYSVYKK